MNIAYACDDNYVIHTGISLISLFKNNEDAEEINIYLISVNISDRNIDEIRTIVTQYGRTLFIVPFEKLCPKLKLGSVGRHIKTVYAKLFFGNLTNVEKIIYLDSDVIINGSLREMFETDLKDNYFGCVAVMTKDYCRLLGLPENQPFYNDGVAIVNVKKLKQDDMENKFLDFINSYDGNPPVLSEGTMNVVCRYKILTIHPKFNSVTAFFMYNGKECRILSGENDYYKDELLKEAKERPVVIHYLAGWMKRPWEIGCIHPFKDLYSNYKSMSVWRDVPLVDKKYPLKITLVKVLSKMLPIKWFVWLRDLKNG